MDIYNWSFVIFLWTINVIENQYMIYDRGVLIGDKAASHGVVTRIIFFFARGGDGFGI